MDEVKLMNRSDTKFVFHANLLQKILPLLQVGYRILETEGTRISSYHSLYFDTKDFLFYHQHHNGKKNRNKVRFREYLDSGLCFLEVKNKTNKGKTIKKRMRVDKIQEKLSGKLQSFVDNIIGEGHQLFLSHQNNFKRITLVHKKNKERLTIDIGLRFKNNSVDGAIKDVVIAEVKQEKISRSSDFIQIIKNHGIRPFRISKYCMATSVLYTQLKNNNFKPKFLHLKKLKNDQ